MPKIIEVVPKIIVRACKPSPDLKLVLREDVLLLSRVVEDAVCANALPPLLSGH
jgi:hypothetical protein